MIYLFLLFLFNPVVNTYRMLGEYYLGLGKPDSAVIYLKEGYSKTGNPELLKLLAEAYYHSGDYKKTLKTLRKLRKNNYYDAELFGQELKVLLSLNKTKKALKLARRYKEHFKDDSTAVFILANLYDILDKREEADTLYKRALSIKKDTVAVLKDYASFLLRSGRLDEAKEVYEKLLELGEQDYKLFLGTASLYEKLGNLEKAIYYYSKVLSLDPSNLNILSKMAQLSLKMDRIQDALKILNAGIELDPFNLNLRYLRALVRRRAGDYTGSTEDFLVVTSIDTTNALAFYYISRNMYNSGKVELALDFIDRALFHNEDRDFLLFKAFLLIKANQPKEALHILRMTPSNRDPYYYFLLGHVYVSLGKEKKSLKYFKKAAELDPENVDRLTVWADVLIDLERKKEAIRVLEKALSLDPDNIEIMVQLATLYGDQGNIERADSLFAEAMKIDSLNPVIYNNWGYLLAKNGVELDRALILIKKALSMDPLNPLYLDSMGWVYYMMGKMDKAKEYLEKAYKRGGRDKEILLHLARLYKKLGNQEKAKFFYKMVLEIDKKNSEAKEFLKDHE